MNIQFKRAIITMGLFAALLLFLVIDFAVVGEDGFLERGNFVMTAVIIFLTMAVFFLMLLVTNKKDNIVDERDNAIQQKATSVALLVTTMFVFLVCITLFIANENVGSIHISWTWLLAYLTFAMAYFSSSAIIVLLYGLDRYAQE